MNVQNRTSRLETRSCTLKKVACIYAHKKYPNIEITSNRAVYNIHVLRKEGNLPPSRHIACTCKHVYEATYDEPHQKTIQVESNLKLSEKESTQLKLNEMCKILTRTC